MKTIAVIPARGGSKGIPRKNMRLMAGKPLISYSIENALASRFIDDVVVSTDSEEILSYAAQFDGVTPLDRESQLAQDAVTLDPVIYDAVARTEQANGLSYDVVVTLQATSPLLTVDVLDAALERFAEGTVDSLISVVNKPHLSWKPGPNDSVVPAYEKRLNRQQLPPNYLETGAFLIARREAVTPDTRLGARVGVFEVPEEQATDIDSKADWVVCEAMLARKRIAFRVDGSREVGLGHVYRALTLAYELTEHDIVFICDVDQPLGIERLHAANMKVVEITSESDLLSWLDDNPIDVFVNDTLDTTAEYVRAVKQRVGRFVSFEDMGPGAAEADAVVNAIYEGASPNTNAYSGSRYVCLRDEFLAATPSDMTERVNRILVTFGGTDPLRLTERLYRIARKWAAEPDAPAFDFVLGPGCNAEGVESAPELNIEVARDVKRMSDHMKHAQLAVCSQGRTTFELAAMGTPALVLAQNERETLHSFAQMGNGFINLGLGSEVSDADVESALRWLVGASTVRAEMRGRMLANDLRSGIARVKRIVLGETL